jgi:hypothetical protein
MHKKTMRVLQDEMREAESKSLSFQTAHLDHPWDQSSPIYLEYTTWVADNMKKWAKRAMDIANELDEEEQWYSGAGDGDSTRGDSIMYDHSDEI